MMHSVAPTMLTRVHYAALRAWLQGLPLDVIAAGWPATDTDDVPGPRAALAMLHTIRYALVRRARLHGREDLANASATPETVLASLCAWLTDRRYLVANPWSGVPAQRTAKPTLQVERAVPVRIWSAMSVWLDAEASFSPHGWLLLVALLLPRETGMRCS